MNNPVDLKRDLLDDDGENLAVRTFLQLYGGTNSPSIEGMRDHLEMSGFDGCWPEWAATQFGFLTKGGAQNWLRYLFALEGATAASGATQMPKLVLALPNYEQRRIVIASDEMIDGERLVCVAIKDAPAPNAEAKGDQQ